LEAEAWGFLGGIVVLIGNIIMLHLNRKQNNAAVDVSEANAGKATAEAENIVEQARKLRNEITASVLAYAKTEINDLSARLDKLQKKTELQEKEIAHKEVAIAQKNVQILDMTDRVNRISNRLAEQGVEFQTFKKEVRAAFTEIRDYVHENKLEDFPDIPDELIMDTQELNVKRKGKR
jgi:chromosome segregation ATPase